MTPPKKENEEKRLQRNLNRRKQYAENEEKRLQRNLNRRKQYVRLQERKKLNTSEKKDNLSIYDKNKKAQRVIARRQRYACLQEEKKQKTSTIPHEVTLTKETLLPIVNLFPGKNTTQINTNKRKRSSGFPKEKKEPTLKKCTQPSTNRKSKAKIEHTTVYPEVEERTKKNINGTLKIHMFLPRTTSDQQSCFTATLISKKGKTQTSFYSSYEIGSSSADCFEMDHANMGSNVPPPGMVVSHSFIPKSFFHHIYHEYLLVYDALSWATLFGITTFVIVRGLT